MAPALALDPMRTGATLLAGDVGVPVGVGLLLAEFVAVEGARVNGAGVGFVAVGGVVVETPVAALVAETDGRIEATASMAVGGVSLEVGLVADNNTGSGVDVGREVSGRLWACSVAIAFTVASTDTGDPI